MEFKLLAESLCFLIPEKNVYKRPRKFGVDVSSESCPKLAVSRRLP